MILRNPFGSRAGSDRIGVRERAYVSFIRRSLDGAAR